jgi:hypothetical protein
MLWQVRGNLQGTHPTSIIARQLFKTHTIDPEVTERPSAVDLSLIVAGRSFVVVDRLPCSWLTDQMVLLTHPMVLTGNYRLSGMP